MLRDRRPREDIRLSLTTTQPDTASSLQSSHSEKREREEQNDKGEMSTMQEDGETTIVRTQREMTNKKARPSALTRSTSSSSLKNYFKVLSPPISSSSSSCK